MENQERAFRPVPLIPPSFLPEVRSAGNACLPHKTLDPFPQGLYQNNQAHRLQENKNYIRSSSWKGGNQSYSWEKKMSKHISESLKAVVTCMRHSGGILRIWRYSLETQWGSEDATKNRRRWIELWEKSHAILLTSSLRLMFTVYLCEPWLWPRGIAAMTHNDGHLLLFLDFLYLMASPKGYE